MDNVSWNIITNQDPLRNVSNTQIYIPEICVALVHVPSTRNAGTLKSCTNCHRCQPRYLVEIYSWHQICILYPNGELYLPSSNLRIFRFEVDLKYHN